MRHAGSWLTKSFRECGVHQGDFMRRSTLDMDGDRAPCRSAIAMIFDPCRVVLPTHVPPPLGGCEAAIDERFLQIQLAFAVERLREGFEDGPQYAGAHPVLKSPVAGLIGRVSVRQVRPWSPGPQDP